MDDVTKDGIELRQHFNSWNPQRLNACSLQPRIPFAVTLWPVTPRMRLAIDFNGKPRVDAEEVEYVRAGRMLAAEFQAVGSLSELLPEQNFG